MDEQLRTVIDQVFPKYDANSTDSLDPKELAPFFNEAFQKLGYNITVTPAQAEQAMQYIDKSSDKQASKTELFSVMKEIISKRKPSRQPTPMSQPAQQPPAANYGNQPPQQPQHNYGPPSNGGWGQQPPNTWQQQPAGWNQQANNWQQPQQQQQYGGWNQPPGNYGESGDNGWGNTQLYSAEDNHYKSLIDSVYATFDRDRSGTLNARELTRAFNHLLRDLGQNMTVTPMQAPQLLTSIDASEDGQVSKSEFLTMLKYLLQQSPY